MAKVPYTIEQALPHDHPMIFLDEVVDWDPEKILTAVSIRPSQPLLQKEGMPAHVAVEYMAQTCGAYVGVEALEAGRTPRIGLLLGTRNFKASQKWIMEGENLLVSAAVVFREDEMGVFDCRVAKKRNDDTVATARLTVFQPSDDVVDGPPHE